MPFLPNKKEMKKLYFILMMDFPVQDRVFPAGTLTAIAEPDYLKEIEGDPLPGRKLKFRLVDAEVSLELEASILQPLSEEQAGLLQAVSPSAKRLHLYLEKEALRAALQLCLNDPVTVEYDSEALPGIVRYIGSIVDNHVLSATFFGIELQVDANVDGLNNGSFGEKRYFQCKENRGIFVPFNKVKLRWSSADIGQTALTGSTNPTDAERCCPVVPGDHVVIYMEEEIKEGTVVGISDGGSTVLVNFTLDPSKGDGKITTQKIPLESIIKREMLQPPRNIQRCVSRESQLAVDGAETGQSPKNQALVNGGSPPRHYLGVKSTVQINMDNGPPVTGVIQWMGQLPGLSGQRAGIELDVDKGLTDGTWRGRRYFDCAPNRGLFAHLASCQPDARFQSLAITREDCQDPDRTAGSRESCVVSEVVPPPRNEDAVRILQGRMRGIQGHCNSCYMDSALFSLFSCTMVLDSMLYKTTFHHNAHIQQILREEIVNPLRRDGFVDCKKVMNLRQELTQGGFCAGFTTEEKDPEEFLNVIMQQVLGLEPLLKLKSQGLKDQECYCHQIFIDEDDELLVPTVQQLVEHSFHCSHLKLTEVPSCFIIQMPRFGKSYKMFEKIIPSLELDITDLLSDSPRECCLCGDLATQECEECFRDKLFSKTGLKQYCDMCWHQVHAHVSRRRHKATPLQCPAEYEWSRRTQVPRERMQLFAVLCIETSHYVSFIKYGPEDDHWMFFDSMADRHGGESGYNIPTVTACPEVGLYVNTPPAQLAKQSPRDMAGVAKRQFCDAYMYLYQNPRMAVYK
ncbi:ubiquitin carboxyl-terminal hydrolase CYLD [Pristis pectinata]|uniref:ubiquitin carboxyl-terminal hydrolase CYLD n=1 Tax=Pristis pectinata TaxID=685728 RepID=UPI00223E79CB|nr:ubiquitin carboxyl-terminal hydrolase CYLD [Pristis pectinata]